MKPKSNENKYRLINSTIVLYALLFTFVIPTVLS